MANSKKKDRPNSTSFVIGAVTIGIILVGITLYITNKEGRDVMHDKIVITNIKTPVIRNLKLYPFNFDMPQSMNGQTFASAVAQLNTEIDKRHKTTITFGFSTKKVDDETIYCNEILCWACLEYLQYFLSVNLDREVKLNANNDPPTVGFE